MTREEYDEFLLALKELKEKRCNLFTPEIHASELYQYLSNRIGTFSEEEKQFIKCTDEFDFKFNMNNRDVFDNELLFMNKHECDKVIADLEEILSKINSFVKKFNWC